MLDVAIAALCSFTYSVSPAIVSPYGAAIDRAISVIEDATHIGFDRVPARGDLEFKPMPPLMFEPEAVGAVSGDDVLLRVVWPDDRAIGLTPRSARQVRVNIALHETLHWLGASHADGIPPVVSQGAPAVPDPVARVVSCGVR